MNAMDSGDESYHDLKSTEMLEDIHDGSQYHLTVNQRVARYKIWDRMRQIQSEWKQALKATKMGKGLHKVFKTVVKYIFAIIATFGRLWFRSFPFHSRT